MMTFNPGSSAEMEVSDFLREVTVGSLINKGLAWEDEKQKYCCTMGVRLVSILEDYMDMTLIMHQTIMERDIVHVNELREVGNWLRCLCAGSGTMTVATFAVDLSVIGKFLKREILEFTCLNISQYKCIKVQ